MGSWRKFLHEHKYFSWLLIFALVLQFLIQLQIHAHHVDHSHSIAGNDHIIDYHIITDDHSSDEHSGNEGIHELKSTPDFILKKSLDWDFNYLLVALVLVFVIVPQVSRIKYRLVPENKLVHNLYFGLSPPVRGPPSI